MCLEGAPLLSALAIGWWAYPARIAEAEDLIRPLVRGQLRDNAEAWAVLAQLLPTLTGTLPELIGGAISPTPAYPPAITTRPLGSP